MINNEVSFSYKTERDLLEKRLEDTLFNTEKVETKYLDLLLKHNEKVNLLQVNLSESEARVEDLQAKLDSSTLKIAEMESERVGILDAASKDQTESENVAKILKDKLKSCLEEMNENSKLIDEMKKERAERQENFSQQIENLSGKLSDLRISANLTQKNKNDQILELNNKMHVLSDENKRVICEMEEISCQFEQASATANNNRKQYIHAMEDIEVLNANVRHLEETLSDYEGQLKDTQLRMRDLEETVLIKEKKLKKLEKLLEGREKKSELIREKKFENTLSNLTKQCDSVSKMAKQISSEKQEQTNHVELLKGNLIRAQNETKYWKSLNSDLVHNMGLLACDNFKWENSPEKWWTGLREDWRKVKGESGKLLDKLKSAIYENLRQNFEVRCLLKGIGKCEFPVTSKIKFLVKIYKESENKISAFDNINRTDFPAKNKIKNEKNEFNSKMNVNLFKIIDQLLRQQTTSTDEQQMLDCLSSANSLRLVNEEIIQSCEEKIKKAGKINSNFLLSTFFLVKNAIKLKVDNSNLIQKLQFLRQFTNKYFEYKDVIEEILKKLETHKIAVKKIRKFKKCATCVLFVQLILASHSRANNDVIQHVNCINRIFYSIDTDNETKEMRKYCKLNENIIKCISCHPKIKMIKNGQTSNKLIPHMEALSLNEWREINHIITNEFFPPSKNKNLFQINFQINTKLNEITSNFENLVSNVNELITEKSRLYERLTNMERLLDKKGKNLEKLKTQIPPSEIARLNEAVVRTETENRELKDVISNQRQHITSLSQKLETELPISTENEKRLSELQTTLKLRDQQVGRDSEIICDLRREISEIRREYDLAANSAFSANRTRDILLRELKELKVLFERECESNDSVMLSDYRIRLYLDNLRLKNVPNEFKECVEAIAALGIGGVRHNT